MQSLVKHVLAAWREAERVASESEPGSSSERTARAAIERLRTVYVDLTDTSDRARIAEPVMPIRQRKIPGRPRH